jgi:sugar lactone lactonase YvrE
VDGVGNIYAADTFNHTVREITPGGAVTTVAGTPGNHGCVDGVGTAEAARFCSPIGVSMDSAGNLYVGDTLNQTIREIAPNGTVTTLAGSPEVQGTNDGVGGNALFEQPVGVAVDGGGNVYVADLRGCTIRKIAAGGGVSTLAGYGGQSGTNDGLGSAARFAGPEGVAVDKAGNVYVTNSADTIRRVTPGGLVTTLAGTPQQSGGADGTNGVARFHAPNGIAVFGQVQPASRNEGSIWTLWR